MAKKEAEIAKTKFKVNYVGGSEEESLIIGATSKEHAIARCLGTEVQNPDARGNEQVYTTALIPQCGGDDRKLLIEEVV